MQTVRPAPWSRGTSARVERGVDDPAERLGALDLEVDERAGGRGAHEPAVRLERRGDLAGEGGRIDAPRAGDARSSRPRDLPDRAAAPLPGLAFFLRGCLDLEVRGGGTPVRAATASRGGRGGC